MVTGVIPSPPRFLPSIFYGVYHTPGDNILWSKKQITPAWGILKGDGTQRTPVIKLGGRLYLYLRLLLFSGGLGKIIFSGPGARLLEGGTR